jgi:hypothetical protein
MMNNKRITVIKLELLTNEVDDNREDWNEKEVTGLLISFMINGKIEARTIINGDFHFASIDVLEKRIAEMIYG